MATFEAVLRGEFPHDGHTHTLQLEEARGALRMPVVIRTVRKYTEEGAILIESGALWYTGVFEKTDAGDLPVYRWRPDDLPSLKRRDFE